MWAMHFFSILGGDLKRFRQLFAHNHVRGFAVFTVAMRWEVIWTESCDETLLSEDTMNRPTELLLQEWRQLVWVIACGCLIKAVTEAWWHKRRRHCGMSSIDNSNVLLARAQCTNRQNRRFNFAECLQDTRGTSDKPTRLHVNKHRVSKSPIYAWWHCAGIRVSLTVSETSARALHSWKGLGIKQVMRNCVSSWL